MSSGDVIDSGSPNRVVTKRLLHALGRALPHLEVPTALDSAEDRRRVHDMQFQQLDAAFGQLRSRYPTAVMAARELAVAVVRATTWVDGLVVAASQAYGPVRLALIATLARRIIIDGLAVARGSLEHCRAGLLEMDTRDDLVPLEG